MRPASKPLAFLFRAACELGLLLLLLRPLHAEQQVPVKTVMFPVEGAPAGTSPAPATLSDLLRAMLLTAMEDEYEDTRHWGMTVTRWDGLKFRGLKVSQREKAVNNGFWQRYKARLIRPEETFVAEVQQGETLSDGRIPFIITMTLRARCEATYVVWSYGVKGLNGTVLADATIRLRLDLATSPRLNFSLENPLPKIELRPEVTDVQISLVDLDLRRVGVVGRSLVEPLGDGLRSSVQQLIRRQRERIQKSLQKSIDNAVGSDDA